MGTTFGISFEELQCSEIINIICEQGTVVSYVLVSVCK